MSIITVDHLVKDYMIIRKEEGLKGALKMCIRDSNKTVFEFVSGDIGAQSTVCGGGRYDGLLKSLGGNDQPALGFAMGIERLLMVAEAQGVACLLYTSRCV